MIQRDQAKTNKVPERLSEMTMCIWVKLTSDKFTDFKLVEYKSSEENNGVGLRLTFPGNLKKKAINRYIFKIFWMKPGVPENEKW